MDRRTAPGALPERHAVAGMVAARAVPTDERAGGVMSPSSPRRVTIPVTMACSVCGSPFTPSGRRRTCSDACRSAAYRRRRAAARPLVPVPAGASRMSLTVYACDGCGSRAVGEQRCPDCSTFMRRLGIGGACPCCDEPITVAELTGLEIGP